MSNNGASAVASEILASLTSGLNFNIPVPDFSGSGFTFAHPEALGQAITPLSNSALTSGTIDGTGTFDVIMRGFAAHLTKEYEAGRITGQEYSKVYVASMGAAINGAVQFLLGKDVAAMQAIQAQLGAINANISLQSAKATAIGQAISAHNIKAQYGLTVTQLATEDSKYGAAAYTLSNILPLQKDLTAEQINTQRAQTHDMRVDGASVTGVLGKQKALYAQQVTSYQRDAEYKIGKLFVDSWVTNRTIDDSVPTPDAFAVTNISSLLTSLRAKNDLT